MKEKRELTVRQVMAWERLQDARAMMTVSPLQRHREKVREALRWIHGFGQSTAELVRRSTRSSSTSFLTSMRQSGLVRTEKVLGQTFWLLTKTGLDLLRQLCGEDDELANLSGQRQVNLYAFGHNVTAQKILAEKLQIGGKGCRWWCERQLRSLTMTEGGVKTPDAAFRSADGVLTYIEVERSRKKPHDLEAMLLSLARLLEDNASSTVEIHIEPGIMDRYKSTVGRWLRSGTFRAWSVSADGELFLSGTGIHPMSESLRKAFERIVFIPRKISI